MSEGAGFTLGGFCLVLLLALSLAGCPQYNVYQQRLAGEAELAHAMRRA